MEKVKCIDSSNRPSDIPISCWVKNGEVYNLINSFYGFNGVLIYQLEELDLTPFPPYKGFAASRFRPVDGLIDDLLEEIEEEIEEFEKRSCYAN